MDLEAVLADGTDVLGNPALARYYRAILPSPPPYPGAFRVQAVLHFGVQQLATRSRVSPLTERYLQIGGFHASDRDAALAEAMEHTQIVEAPEGSNISGVFGFIAVFSEGAKPDPDLFRPLLNPIGRILAIHRLSATDRPCLALHHA